RLIVSIHNLADRGVNIQIRAAFFHRLLHEPGVTVVIDGLDAQVVIQLLDGVTPLFDLPLPEDPSGKRDVRIVIKFFEPRYHGSDGGSPSDWNQLSGPSLVGSPNGSNLAVGPWLRNDPVDKVAVILDGIPCEGRMPDAKRSTGPAFVDKHDCIAVA